MSIERLKQLQESMAVKHQFKAGDIVKWKEGLKNKRLDGPFTVVEVMDAPVTDNEDSSGNPYFREPLDLVLGFIDRDGHFTCVHFDSRRFEPAQ